MKDGEPIGFVTGEGSPEIREIEQAIKEADQWILENQGDIKNIELELEVVRDALAYQKEYKLSGLDPSEITKIEKDLETARENLLKNHEIRNQLIKLQTNFRQLNWRQELQRIRMNHLLKNDKFPKPVD